MKIVVMLFGAASAAAAQQQPAALGLSEQAFWAGSAVIFGSALLLDHTAREEVPEARSPFTGSLSSVGNTLGLARYDVPVVLAALVAGHLSRNRRFADATTHIALSYVTADVTESVLKSVVRRARPYDPRSHDSFPSAHLAHISSIAAAVAEEARSPWVTALAGTTVSLVGWQRMYARQHWASDVAAGAIIGVGLSRLTAHWLRGVL